MPELPEVHTITSDLKKHLEGSSIIDVRISKDYSLFPNNADFIKSTKGTKIERIHRIGKNIVIETNSGSVITIHLAMTGRALIRKSGFPEDSWIRVIFVLKKNDENIELRFTDKRKFGKVKLLTQDEMHKLNLKYGPEPIQTGLTPLQFLTQIKSKKTNIKNLLLDQTKISGMGNVYVNDALFLAGINPRLNTQDVDLEMATKLLNCSKEMLEEGIAHRGISMRDYVDAFGQKGTQQEHFRVYSKENCPNCKTKITFEKINGRGTYYCEECQKLPSNI